MISVEALSRTYGDLKAVDRVSFSIGQGEIVGLLGHNGAGKTTIMKMLTGFLEPSAGSIRIDGLDIASQRQALQARIGYLPENDPLYPEMPVIDYLDFAAALHGVSDAERPRRIRQAIERTALAAKAGDAISTLSRGYRQRVGVAQAILHQPKLLILDEPTNGLDPTQVQQMRALIRELAQEATIIISTHILQEVQALCSRVIIMRNGVKALDASMAELRAGRRLLLTLDAQAAQVEALLAGLDAVASCEWQAAAEPGQRYALGLAPDQEMASVAAEVAARVVGAGVRLYGLQPENRDLETIFREISVH